MEAYRSKNHEGVRQLKPDTLVLLLLAAWWVINLLQAAFTGLANDEAYYWYFAQHLDWGYFDHPPMVALLVWLSSWMPGTLGIRFFATLLQPLYLLIFWHLIKPADATRRDALLYVLLCFSQPLLQLYGFMALPDAPLMMFSVLFLWAFKRFDAKTTLANALLLGLTVALLAYSKYHGALVVLLVLLARPKVFTRWQLYVAGLTALLLMVPHLWWQYTHDWVSFRYHLAGRNAWGYELGYTLEYLGILLALFNPLWIYHLVHGMRKASNGEEPLMRRASLLLCIGFWAFFLLATLRGRVQPQWLLPTVLPVVALVFHAARRSRYVYTAAIVCAMLFCAVRIIAAFNPLHFKGELWEGKEPYQKIAALADGRPVQFIGCYAVAAKYAYYTGNPTHCTSYYYARSSQWQYDTTDRTFTGREVLVADFGNIHGEEMEIGNGTLHYLIANDFLPMRELQVENLKPVDLRLTNEHPYIELPLAVTNPYPYDICSSEERPIKVALFFQWGQNTAAEASVLLTDTLRANSTTVITPQLPFHPAIPDGEQACGFDIGYISYAPAANSKLGKATVTHDDGGVTIHSNL